MRTYILLILICSNSLLAQKVKNEFFYAKGIDFYSDKFLT